MTDNQEIKDLCKSLEDSMLDYMEHASYTKSDVDECMTIVKTYLDKMNGLSSRDEGMKLVETTVKAINQLNERCDHEMIETDQREDLAEIIIVAANLKGFNPDGEDITEEWREW